jgi:carboxyl-terminal processing protease
LVRAIVKMPTIEDINDKQAFPLGENGIGYVRINQFGEKTVRRFARRPGQIDREGMKALILDLRNNPGGLLDQAEHVCEQFVPNGHKIVSTEGRGPAPNTSTRPQPRQAH